MFKHMRILHDSKHETKSMNNHCRTALVNSRSKQWYLARGGGLPPVYPWARRSSKQLMFPNSNKVAIECNTARLQRYSFCIIVVPLECKSARVQDCQGTLLALLHSRRSGRVQECKIARGLFMHSCTLAGAQERKSARLPTAFFRSSESARAQEESPGNLALLHSSAPTRMHCV